MNATEAKAEEQRAAALRHKLTDLLIAEIPGMLEYEGQALGTAMAAVADILGCLIGASFSPDSPAYLKAFEEVVKRVVHNAECVRKQAAVFESVGMSNTRQ